MKLFLRNLRIPITLFGLFPVPLSICLFFAPTAIPYLCIETIFTLILTFIVCIFTGRKRIIAGLVGALLLLLSIQFLDWHNAPVLLSLPILSILEMFLLIRPDHAHAGFNLPFFIFCLILYAAIQISRLGVLALPLPWSALSPSFEISFILFGLSCLLQNNMELLEAEIRFGRNVPAGIIRVNRFNILCLLFLSVLIACIPQIAQFLSFLYRQLKHQLHILADFITGLFAENAPDTGAATGLSPSALPMEETVAENAPNPVLELLMNIFTGLVLAALTLFLLYRLGKVFLRLFRFIARRFQAYLGSFDHVYTDTYEDLSDTHGMGETLRRSGRSPLPRKAGTPREQIRLLYRKRLRKHPEWSPADTAQDHLVPAAAHLYEEARYSAHSVTENDAETFASLIDTPSAAG